MEPYRVFISSIMNRSTEDLLSERDAARSAVEHFAPTAAAWAFEAEPASAKPLLDFYIGAVKTSDLVVVIVGIHITTPVQKECEAARDYGKPILTFCKDVANRATGTDVFLRSLNLKYDQFSTASELREKIRKALGIHLLHLIRGETEETQRFGDRIARLRVLARTRSVVRISPLVPPIQYDRFLVKDVRSDVLIVDKESSDEQVTIPVQRVAEILPTKPGDAPLVMLNGRLQWLTLEKEWEFFPERPDPSDGLLGLPKNSSSHDPILDNLIQRLAAHGMTCLWSHVDKLPARLNAKTHQVFYDADGRYLRQVGPDRICHTSSFSRSFVTNVLSHTG
jgi:hypothetical protein